MSAKRSLVVTSLLAPVALVVAFLPAGLLYWLFRPGRTPQGIVVSPQTTFITTHIDRYGLPEYTRYFVEVVDKPTSPAALDAGRDLVRVLAPNEPTFAELWQPVLDYFELTVPMGTASDADFASFVFAQRVIDAAIAEVLASRGVAYDPTTQNARLIDPRVTHSMQRAYHERFNAALSRPWSRRDAPFFAEWVDAHRVDCEELIRISSSEAIFVPAAVPLNLGERLTECPQHTSLLKRMATRWLMLYANHALADDDPDLAWQCARAALDISRRTPSSSPFDISVDAHSRGMAFQVVNELVNRPDAAELLPAITAYLDQLPPLASPAEAIGGLTRLQILQTLYCDLYGEETTERKRTEMSFGVDVNEAAARINRWIDAIVAAARIPSPTSRRDELKKLTPQGESSRSKAAAPTGNFSLPFIERKAPKTSKALEPAAWFGNLDYIQLIVDEANTKLSLTRIACTLRQIREEQGSYPEALDAAYAVDPSLPRGDTMAGAPFRYQRLRTGFVLYSIGANSMDDRALCWRSDPIIFGTPLDPQERLDWFREWYESEGVEGTSLRLDIEASSLQQLRRTADDIVLTVPTPHEPLEPWPPSAPPAESQQ